MTALMPAIDAIVFERLRPGVFVARSGVPAWAYSVRPRVAWNSPVVLEGVFPFLGVFLPEAERAWQSDTPTPVESDFWSETDEQQHDVHLRAVAVKIKDVRALIVVRNDRVFLQNQRMLQRARELRLVHASLMREVEQKDILVHSIVHDLAAPLHSVVGLLSLLDERAHEEPEAGWIHQAMEAANRQRGLIGEILDIFTAESGGSLGISDPEGVELADVLEQVVAERVPTARARSLQIELEPVSPTYVVADRMRLFRVMTNLVDNALRHSPTGGVVRVAVQRDDDGDVRVCVDDEGPGVAVDVLPRLFEKFPRGRDRAGTGLGLFFCRITVENWGGGIGYERSPRSEKGGARFWIRLKAAPAPHNGRATGGRAHGDAPDAG
jgi:signal transduction histidine kinase